MPQAETPAVHLILRAHPPAPARVGLEPRALPLRLLLAAAPLLLGWSLAPLLLALPPHYPWPVLCFGAGAWLAHRGWTGRYRVRWFAGNCPRCAAPLRLLPGERVSLPHGLTCFHCHFEPSLEVYDLATEERCASDARGIRHVLNECAGSWREEVLWGQGYLTCSDCGARHHATAALAEAAHGENERGRILQELAAEGRFLT